MTTWQPIETAPKDELLLLYFPAEKAPGGGYRLTEMIKVDQYPVYYPRKPTHWMPLPESPQ